VHASRRLMGGAVSLATIAGLVVIPATSAHADSPHCSGALCAELLQASTTVFIIGEWSDADFTGHFQLQTPSGANLNTQDKTWTPQETFGFSVTRQNGQYCANEWQHNSSGGYDRIGGICWTISP
jgi:hypothetical protein